VRLNKSQINSFTFPYNSSFIKLFETYEVKTITQCQFYSGFLPFNYLFDLKRTNLYSMLNASHALLVFCFTGLVRMKYLSDIANEYNLSHAFNKSSTVQMDIFRQILFHYWVDMI